MDFIFKTGFSGQLAALELSSALGSIPQKISDQEYLVSLPGMPALNQLANRLGGLVEVVFADTKKLVWRHSAKYWQKVDTNKPYANPRKGLLPPKIARQLVNIAVGPQIEPRKVLLDPFCGSGTVLLEAAHLGLSVVGADLDLEQLRGARANLKWAKIEGQIIKADATDLSSVLERKVDYIVTEPFMGKPQFDAANAENIARGLAKLYLGALKEWLKILNPGGKVVMIFPIFQTGKGKIATGDIVDHSSLSGYNVLARNIQYSQPKARVVREIIVLEKK